MLKKLNNFIYGGPRDMNVVKQDGMAILAGDFIAATQRALQLGEQLQQRLDTAKADLAATTQRVADSIKPPVV